MRKKNVLRIIVKDPLDWRSVDAALAQIEAGFKRLRRAVRPKRRSSPNDNINPKIPKRRK